MKGMPRLRSGFICPHCGEAEFLTTRQSFSKLLNRHVTYFYCVHARKNLTENKWRRFWHYIDTDHAVEIKRVERPTRVWQK